MKATLLVILLSSFASVLYAQPPSQGQTATPPQMQARMQAMREQMERIQATKDPEERERLMHEHMQTMQQNMTMMGEMMRAPIAGNSGGPGNQARPCAQSDTECRMGQMQMQQGMMGERMNMMQQMMQQMMAHMMHEETQEHENQEHGNAEPEGRGERGKESREERRNARDRAAAKPKPDAR